MKLTRAQRRRESNRQLVAIKRRRNALVLELAPDLACATCGEVQTDASKLEVDHATGATWSRRALSYSMRVAKYRREKDAGVPMRALCVSCSRRDGARRKNTGDHHVLARRDTASVEVPRDGARGGDRKDLVDAAEGHGDVSLR